MDFDFDNLSGHLKIVRYNSFNSIELPHYFHCDWFSISSVNCEHLNSLPIHNAHAIVNSFALKDLRIENSQFQICFE